MSGPTPHLLSQVINTPLMLHPRAAMTIFNVLAGRCGLPAARLPDFDAGMIDGRIKASRFYGDMVRTEDGKFPAVEPYKRTPDGVAIITVDGELVNRGAYVGADSGLVSYEGTKFQLARAAKDQKTRGVILDINSPGGDAIGASEMASAVRAVATVKPVYAVANGMAASAAYALSSGATRVFAAPSSLMGSIGVLMLHMDYSRALEKAGVTPTLIYAGAQKTVGNSVEPLDDDDQEELQADIDKFYEGFLSTVAEGRGRKMSAKAARATEARTYIGADAVAIGLADAVGTFEDVLGELTSKIVRASARNMGAKSALPKGAYKMAETETETETLIRQAAETAREEGLDAGRRAGERAALDRISAIMADTRIKGREIFALKLAAKSPSLPADDVCSLVADIPVQAAARDISAEVLATGVNGITAGPLGGPGNSDPWEKSIAKVNRAHL